MRPAKILIFQLIASAACLFLFGCAHRTAMSDPKLAPLWNGRPLPDEQIEEAKQKWPNDATLIDMQEGTAILRNGKLTQDQTKRAHTYFENAYNTFEDLRDPENFSKAFTPDNQTPYRGRPYERVLTGLLVGLLDSTNGRCDMALPAFKGAEFLDARWQPFLFGTDAPMVYALMLRCLFEIKSADQDVDRARDGLIRALRMQLLLEPMLREINMHAKRKTEGAADKIALSLLEVGIPSALIAAPAQASFDEILRSASTQSMVFLTHVIKEKESPYYDIIRPLLKKLDGGDELSASATAQVEQALQSIWKTISSYSDIEVKAPKLLEKTNHLAKRIEKAAQQPVMIVRFDGQGPGIKQEGAYNEIARIIPSSEENARAGVPEKPIELEQSCGVTNDRGALTFVLCKPGQGKNRLEGRYDMVKLWSSSFQATTMVGRKFATILKGRAEFRMGTEIAAVVGGAVALELLAASTQMRGPQAQHVQTAALVVGALAGAAWLAGRATNPEADTRHVLHNLESGYVVLP